MSQNSACSTKRVGGERGRDAHIRVLTGRYGRRLTRGQSWFGRGVDVSGQRETTYNHLDGVSGSVGVRFFAISLRSRLAGCRPGPVCRGRR